MNLQITKWGSIQPIYAHSGKIIGEIVSFHSNGTPHRHIRDWELCTVLKGKGEIIQTKSNLETIALDEVKAGSIVAIPPGTRHWMEPDFSNGKELVIFIAYTPSVNYHE